MDYFDVYFLSPARAIRSKFSSADKYIIQQCPGLLKTLFYFIHKKCPVLDKLTPAYRIRGIKLKVIFFRSKKQSVPENTSIAGS